MSGDLILPTGDFSATRVRAVGYLRQYGSMTCRQFGTAKEQLAALAERSGFELCQVFVEQLHTDPAAFEELLQVVKLRNVAAVLVPNRAHLSSVGGDETKIQRLQRETRSEVLVADACGLVDLD